MVQVVVTLGLHFDSSEVSVGLAACLEKWDSSSIILLFSKVSTPLPADEAF
jgi:hypothetical protein